MEIINNFCSIYCLISFILGGGLMLVILAIVAISKDTKSKNKVHFYVARDKDGDLYFYPTKPIRKKYCFIPNYDKDTAFTFKGFNGSCLSTKSFDNLKWEDEPVEVLLNLED